MGALSDLAAAIETGGASADDGIPEFLRRTATPKEDPMKVGPKEQQTRDLKAARAKKIVAAVPNIVITGNEISVAEAANPPGPTKPAASAPAQPQETTMKTKTKTTTKTTRKASAPKTTPKAKTRAAANARTPVARAAKPPKGPKVAPQAGERADGLRTGSKQAIMLDMALADGGATEAEICAKLGWKKCRTTLKRTADKVGAKLEGKKNGDGVTVWTATAKG